MTIQQYFFYLITFSSHVNILALNILLSFHQHFDIKTHVNSAGGRNPFSTNREEEGQKGTKLILGGSAAAAAAAAAGVSWLQAVLSQETHEFVKVCTNQRQAQEVDVCLPINMG